MKLEVGKSYITECGYIATLGKYFRDVNRTPGLNNAGESTSDNEMGWSWASDGQIFGLKPEWREKLKIIAEFEGKIPFLPEGYEWKHGYPCLETPLKGDYYIVPMLGNVVIESTVENPKDLTSRRFTVLAKAKPKTSFAAGDFVVCIEATGNLVEKGIYKVEEYLPNCNQVKIKTTNYSFWFNAYRFVLAGTGKPKPDKDITLGNLASAYFKEARCDVVAKCVKVMEDGFNKNVLSEGTEQMKKETAIKVATGVTKFAASSGFRILNYWLFEPATDLGKPVVKAFRYVVFLSALSGSVYTYYHPQATLDFVKSCLPTVTVESPEILK